jgi:hypothetical protein
MALFSWIVRRKRDVPIEFVDAAIATLIKVHGRGHRRSIAYSRQTSTLNSAAVFLIALCLSVASTVPGHTWH